jgi:hypothetical protein
MGAKKIIGIVLVVLGVLALVVFLLADILGYGRPGFGIRQIIGTIAGGVATIVGLILLLTRK